MKKEHRKCNTPLNVEKYEDLTYKNAHLVAIWVLNIYMLEDVTQILEYDI